MTTQAISRAERLRAVWAAGDYPAVATQVVPALGPRLVQACGVRPRDRVLDVAAGTGNAAVPAAMAGAEVVAIDITPELLDVGRADAERRGVRLQWRTADAEELPFDDAEFDVVMSCVGVMFAPHHQTVADEFVRVCRPGGTVGLLNWTPAGFIGQMLGVLKPFAPPPAPGAHPGPLWGTEDHVRDLFGDRVDEATFRTETLEIDCFESPEEFRDFFKACYGPVIAVYRTIAGDPGRVAALDAALAELARRQGRRTTDGAFRMDWEYLLAVARRTG